MAKEGRPFYSKWVWKDWLAKTQDLNPHEYSAYHRLLTYAATTSPDLCTIPADDHRLARISGLGTRLWNRYKGRVLAFWDGPHEAPKRGSIFLNLRLLSEAGQWFQLVEKQRQAACIRHSQTSAILDLDSKTQKESKKKNPQTPSRSRSLAEPSGFEDFYRTYPRRVGRPSAARAYRKALAEGVDPTLLLSAAHRFASSKPDTQFTPYPATWLNDKRWQDDPGLSLVEGENPYTELQLKVRAEMAKLEAKDAAL